MGEFEPLYTAEEMKAAEEGRDVEAMMERAGVCVASVVLSDFEEARRITVVCGSGHNGGDGKVAARHLEAAGREVRIVDIKPEDESKDLGQPDVIVDAIFGTGFSGEPRSRGRSRRFAALACRWWRLTCLPA